MREIISELAVFRRLYWVNEFRKISGNFGDDSARVEKKLTVELKDDPSGLLDHLRLCGDIPESYNHDSTEEKLYSKYTDILLCLAYKAIGLESLVLTERGDAADVEAFAKDYSFVGDAKAFRLSRTAKNAKDFKVASMDLWKRGKPYAMVVAPIYQLPTKTSQIYQQATSRNVCIFTYSHLCVLLLFAGVEGPERAEGLLHKIFKTVAVLNPSKSGFEYWPAINSTMLEFSACINELWATEKLAAVESIAVAKEVALTFLASERERIMRMGHKEALIELIRVQKIESRIAIINRVAPNNILGII